MNRRIPWVLLALIGFLWVAGLGGCSCNGTPSNNEPETVAVESGSGQSTTVNTAFAAPLVAVVTKNGSALSGVTVTFTLPASGASAAFGVGCVAPSCGGNTATATTGSNGQATSPTLIANGTAGSYTVTATVSGVASPANFSLTNNAQGVTTENFTFYFTGLESINSGPNLYGAAGVVTINTQTGAVIGGEQDYNDGFGLSTTEPDPDTISGGQLSINSNGQGTLTLNVSTSDSNLGNAGVETLGVQFANNDHALIIQFDGSGTSSGSMDLQTLTLSGGSPASPSGAFSFTSTGTDPDSCSLVAGGVFSLSGLNLQNGVVDDNTVNEVGAPSCFESSGTGAAFSGTITAPDSLGRGTITATASGLAPQIAYYVVNSKVFRFIDIDFNNGDTGVGSAYSQGTTTFSNASIGASIFGFESNGYGFLYAAAGMLATSNTSSSPANFTGLADDDEEGSILSAASISGTYTMNVSGVNGYGNLAIASDGVCTGALADVCDLGVYMVDPTLNINDPNNTSSGQGGALLAELDALAGTGVLVPQTDTSTASFTGNYAFGAQVLDSNLEEFDFVGQGPMTAGSLSGTALVSDPFFFLTPNATDTGVTFDVTPIPSGTAGYYSASTVSSSTDNDYTVVFYQASGGQLFWLDEDAFTLWVGPVQQQTLPLTTLPIASAVIKPAAKPNQK